MVDMRTFLEIISCVMSTLSVRLPRSLHEEIKALARKEGVSMNQFIAVTLAEKATVLRTTQMLKQPLQPGDLERFRALLRLQPGDLERFRALLDKVPDVEPEEYDRL